MSLVDISKLIALKKFFIPFKSSDIHGEILKQLKLDDGAWETEVKRLRGGIFGLSFRIKWVEITLNDKGLPVTKFNIENEAINYDKQPIKNMVSALARLVHKTPYEISYVITEEGAEGCVCEVKCFPVLYLKTIRHLPITCSEAEIQDARLQCEDFMVHLIVGGLKGKEIVERREASHWELLINDVNCQQITDRIYKMLEQATGEILLVGWVGTLLLGKLKELKSKGVDIKVITHKSEDAKGQPWAQEIHRAYKELIDILGLENISTKPELHGRAVIVDNKAIIGSMDLNAYSLTGPHVEFAIYTEDADTVRNITDYFRKIFTPLKV